MIPLRQAHSSFVIHIWWEEAGTPSDSQPIWRAWVQHACSGEAVYVSDLPALLAKERAVLTYFPRQLICVSGRKCRIT